MIMVIPRELIELMAERLDRRGTEHINQRVVLFDIINSAASITQEDLSRINHPTPNNLEVTVTVKDKFSTRRYTITWRDTTIDRAGFIFSGDYGGGLIIKGVEIDGSSVIVLTTIELPRSPIKIGDNLNISDAISQIDPKALLRLANDLRRLSKL